MQTLAQTLAMQYYDFLEGLCVNIQEFFVYLHIENARAFTRAIVTYIYWKICHLLLQSTIELNMNENIGQQFDHRIADWLDKLASRIAETRAHLGETPVLIAISRKMPRLLNWILNEWHPGEYDSQKDSIKSVELTTEIALPFIALDTDISRKKFIVIDDVLVHGTTLRSIIKFLKAVKANYELSIIFTSKEAEIADIEAEEPLSRGHLATSKVAPYYIDAFVERIVGYIKETELPIDFEFPIFKSASADFDVLTAFIEREVNKGILELDETYKIADNRYVCIFNNDIHNIADFLKVRFFRKSDSVRFEVFTPLVLESSTICGSDSVIFTDDNYQQIWDNATKNIREAIMNKNDLGNGWMNTMHLSINCQRTLSMFANYLMAISFYNSVKAKLLPNVALSDFLLSEEDLNLIVSKETSRKIFDSLCALIKKGHTTQIFQKKLDLIDDDFAPESLRDAFEAKKSELRIVCTSQESALLDFVQWQHYSNPLFQKPAYRYQRLLFGNTLESFNEISDFYYKDTMEISLNNLIDSMVDNGCLIPKYECVTDTEYGAYWRRFFEPGLNKATYHHD